MLAKAAPHPGQVAGLAQRRGQRLSVGMASAKAEAAHGVGGKVSAPIGPVGAGSSIRGNGGDDESGEPALEGLIVQSHLFDQGQRLVFQEDVGGFQQPVQ